jgi:hypothetical protein
MAVLSLENSPNGVAYTKNPIVFAFSTDKFAEYNARMYASIVVNSVVIATIEERPDPNTHQYVFRLQQYLDDYINEYDFLKESELAFTAALPVCSKTAIEYTVNFEEKYSEADTSDASPTSFTGIAIKGGINFESFPDDTDFFDNYLTDTKKFLTWLPEKMKISRLQPITLYFYNYTEGTLNELILSITAKLFNGTTVTTGSDSLNITTALAAKDILIVPCGPESIDLFSLFPGSEVLEYTVSLDNHGTQVSEERTFVIDRIIRSNDRIFSYLNSLGGVDHILCTGKAENKGEYSGSVAQREVALDLTSNAASYNRMNPQFFDYNLRENILKKVHSGPKTLREIDCFRDFRLSPFKMEYLLLSSPKYVPILFDGKTNTYPKDKDSAPAFDFSYRYGFENNVFTPADVIQPVTPSS